MLALYDEIYSLFALNELDTYRFSVSSAGAGGMVQMIPWAYNLERTRHPGVGLIPDFVTGMRNHGNALQAMLLYMHDTWNDLTANDEVKYALNAKIATPSELLAAGYNSNAAKLPGYLRRGGDGWRTLIPRETQMYLQIYKSFEGLVPIAVTDRRHKHKVLVCNCRLHDCQLKPDHHELHLAIANRLYITASRLMSVIMSVDSKLDREESAYCSL